MPDMFPGPPSIASLLYTSFSNGEAGGDGKILIFEMAGDCEVDIGASLLSGLSDGDCVLYGCSTELRVGEKLSRGFGSGGDMRLEIDGSLVMFVVLGKVEKCGN